MFPWLNKYIGLTKTKQLLREKIWFPGIEAMTKQLLDNCIACQANVIQHSFAPLQMITLSQAPWQYLSADFCGPLPSGDMLFVVIDEYSLYPEVEIVRSTSANTVTQSSIVSYLHTEFLPKLKQTTVLLSKVTHSPSLRSTWISTTVKSPPLGPKLIRSQNVLSEHSTKPYVPPIWKIKIGNKNCSTFCATIVPHPIPPREFPLLSFFFGRKLVVKLPELITTAPSRSSTADTDMKQKAKM